MNERDASSHGGWKNHLLPPGKSWLGVCIITKSGKHLKRLNNSLVDQVSKQFNYTHDVILS